MTKPTMQISILIIKQHCVNFTKKWLQWQCKDKICEKHVNQLDILWFIACDVEIDWLSSLIRWLLISKISTVFHLIIGLVMIFLTSLSGDQMITIWKLWKRVKIMTCYKIKESIICMITFKLSFLQLIRVMKTVRELLMEYQTSIRWQNILL